MQQRVALVRAFALGAPFLLMDEPFAALDEITRADMRHLLAELCEPLSTTVLFVTHSLAESVFLSDRVAVLSTRPGRVVGIEPIDAPPPATPGTRGRPGVLRVGIPAPAPPPRRRWAMRQRSGLWAAIGLVTFLVCWQLLVEVRDIKPFVLLAPSEIFAEIADHPSYWLEATWRTSWHTIVGVAIAFSSAILIGAVLAAYRPLEWAAQPVLVLIMVTPWVAYITSVVLWLGRGTPTILFMIAFVTFPPFVFAAVLGMRSADVAAREVLASVEHAAP